jgi:hypothetical protein
MKEKKPSVKRVAFYRNMSEQLATLFSPLFVIDLKYIV